MDKFNMDFKKYILSWLLKIGNYATKQSDAWFYGFNLTSNLIKKKIESNVKHNNISEVLNTFESWQMWKGSF